MRPNKIVEIKEVKGNPSTKDSLLPLLLPLHASSSTYGFQELRELLETGVTLRVMKELEIDWGTQVCMEVNEKLLEWSQGIFHFYKDLEYFCENKQWDPRKRKELLKNSFSNKVLSIYAGGVSVVTDRMKKIYPFEFVRHPQRGYIPQYIHEFTKICLDVSASEVKKQKEYKYIQKADIQKFLDNYDRDKGLVRTIAENLHKKLDINIDAKDSAAIKKIKDFMIKKPAIFHAEVLFPFIQTLLGAKELAKNNRKSNFFIGQMYDYVYQHTRLHVQVLHELLKNLSYYKILKDDTLALFCRAVYERDVSRPDIPLSDVFEKLASYNILTLDSFNQFFSKIQNWENFSKIFNIINNGDSSHLITFTLKYLNTIETPKTFNIYRDHLFDDLKTLFTLFKTPLLKKLNTLDPEPFKLLIKAVLAVSDKKDINQQKVLLKIFAKNFIKALLNKAVNDAKAVNDPSQIACANHLLKKYNSLPEKKPEQIESALYNFLDELKDEELTLLKKHLDSTLKWIELYGIDSYVFILQELENLNLQKLLDNIDTDHIKSFIVLMTTYHMEIHNISERMVKNISSGLNAKTCEIIFTLLLQIPGSESLNITLTISESLRSINPKGATLSSLELIKMTLPNLLKKRFQGEWSQETLSFALKSLLSLNDILLIDKHKPEILSEDFHKAIYNHKDLANLERALRYLSAMPPITEVGIKLFFVLLCDYPEATSEIADAIKIFLFSPQTVRFEMSLETFSKFRAFPHSAVFFAKCFVLLGDAASLVTENQTHQPYLNTKVLLDLGEDAYSFSYGLNYLKKHLDKEFFDDHKIRLFELLKQCAPHAMSLAHLIVWLVNKSFFIDDKIFEQLKFCAPHALYLGDTLEEIYSKNSALLINANIKELFMLESQSLRNLKMIFSNLITCITTDSMFVNLLNTGILFPNLVKLINTQPANNTDEELLVKALLPLREKASASIKDALSQCFWNCSNPSKDTFSIIIAYCIPPLEIDNQNLPRNKSNHAIS